MPGNLKTRSLTLSLKFFLLLAWGVSIRLQAQTVTNLVQLSEAVRLNERAVRDVSLDVLVCASSRSQVGALVVSDSTDVQLLEIGSREEEFHPGDRVHIEARECLLRRREMVGIELSAKPVVDNDGLHARTTTGTMALKAGWLPLRLDWFNHLRVASLEATFHPPSEAMHELSESVFYAETLASGQTNFVKGLRAKCVEGYWETVPDFGLYPITKTGVITNFNVDFRSREEMVAVRYEGFLNVPFDGVYTFQLSSDDGSLLFLGDPLIPIQKMGETNVPPPGSSVIGETVADLNARSWAAIEGRVDFVSRIGEGLKLELHSERDSITVRLADASGLDVNSLLNSYVRVVGVSCGALTMNGRVVLARLFATGAGSLSILEQSRSGGQLPALLTSARQVQNLKLEDARRSLPVRIRGVVTAVSPPLHYWVSIQDADRGIFVDLHAVSNTVPTLGELWEVDGHTGAGDFAPIIFADGLKLLGEARMPVPARPTWNELNNGNMDSQRIELQGLVTGVQSNMMTLLLPDGKLNVQLEGYYEPELRQFLRSVIRLRATLFAFWKNETREVKVGTVLMRNATINVDMPAPTDPFDAPVKTPADLFLFDVQATAFQRVKVRGVVVHADAKRIFLMGRGVGMRVLPNVASKVNTGDWIEAVGYPDISGPSPLLREAIVRKTDRNTPLIVQSVSATNLLVGELDSTLIRVQGRLVGTHSEPDAFVLEMQSDTHLFLARLGRNQPHPALQPGSQLALTGVYVAQGGNRRPESAIDSFELLLNSAADIVVLSKPSWWTLRRMLTVMGVLIVVLVLAALWITQLRRKVEQRTRELQNEIRERQHAERQRAIEAERSRIARDLHDDLGAALTEISVLASTGRHPPGSEMVPATLFRAIADKVHELVFALDVIVWAVDPEDNSLQSLADYIGGFVGEFLSHSSIVCRFKIPVTFPPVILDGGVRHDLLLAVKETLNNIVRHSQATEVELRMGIVDNILEVAVSDNGHGFEADAVKYGHGLENLSARLAKCGGTCVVESRAGIGTNVTMHLPLQTAQSADGKYDV